MNAREIKNYNAAAKQRAVLCTMKQVRIKECKQEYELRRAELKKKRAEGVKHMRQKATIALNHNRHHIDGPNGLERAGNALLDALGICYETQVLVCGFLVDVLIPDKRIVIQWGGDFWHSFKDAKYMSQLKQIARDRHQNDTMRQAGYTVIRFWEHEVHKQRNVVSLKIKELVA